MPDTANAADNPSRDDAEALLIGVDDSRRVMAYLLAAESDDYIAVMEVLESSVTDLSPAEVARALHQAGTPLDGHVVDARLEKLRHWGAATARHDTSTIQRYTDLLTRNWRYTATQTGRQVHRFYRSVLSGVPTMREIPLPSLRRVVESLEELAQLLDAAEANGRTADPSESAELIGRLFTSHDDLDAALVGAEDTLADLADRFDLDDARTADLKRMLVDYATHVAAELEHGSVRAHRALTALAPHTDALVQAAISSSEARVLIERGALTASRGGRAEDWAGLTAWFDPADGRAARFALRLVRALPGMHANLRRLHSSASTATTRSRALTFAKACSDESVGTAIWMAALGDHPWRKITGTAEDEELVRGATTWRDGPGVDLPEMLRATGRVGARGRAAAGRDDTQARERVAARRAEHDARHREALTEVLKTEPGALLTDAAARVALAALNAAARAARRPAGPGFAFAARTAQRDGLACTLLYVGAAAGAVRAPSWRVLTPGRVAVFHLPGRAPRVPAGLSISDEPLTAARAVVVLEEGAA